MEKNTKRILKFRSVKEEHDLAMQLDKLQLKKKQAALQHDRAQSAFMKRYSALLQRKNGALVPNRKMVPEKRAENFMVSGAKLSEKFEKRVPSRPEQIPLSAVYDKNVFTSASSDGADDITLNGTSFSKPSRSLPISPQTNQLPPRLRVLSRSAPTARYGNRELLTIREYNSPSRWPQNKDKYHSVPGRYIYRETEADPERHVRKAWSPDLKVSSYRQTVDGVFDTVPSAYFYRDAVDGVFDTVPSADFLNALPSNHYEQLRGILINKKYSFKFCGKSIDDLQREIMASSRRRSSVPYDNNELREQMRRSGVKKHVTFIESQIAGHEADGENPPRNLSGRFRGLNIVTLMADRDGSDFKQQELCRSAPKVFAP